MGQLNEFLDATFHAHQKVFQGILVGLLGVQILLFTASLIRNLKKRGE